MSWVLDRMKVIEEGSKQALDAVSVVAVLGSLGELLPPFAALFTIIWTGIRIYETDTVQKALGKK